MGITGGATPARRAGQLSSAVAVRAPIEDGGGGIARSAAAETDRPSVRGIGSKHAAAAAFYSIIRAAPLSPIIRLAALVFAEVISGITEAAITRSFSTPRT